MKLPGILTATVIWKFPFSVILPSMLDGGMIPVNRTDELVGKPIRVVLAVSVLEADRRRTPKFESPFPGSKGVPELLCCDLGWDPVHGEAPDGFLDRTVRYDLDMPVVIFGKGLPLVVP